MARPAVADQHVPLILEHFRPGPTADIGCGSGRDTAWLVRQGFAVAGYDASEGLLAEARRRYPGLDFHHAALPDLTGVADAGFANILCETALMHLPAPAIAAAVRRLVSLLAPGGTLYLSWRVTVGADRRDPQGRLYAAFDAVLARHGLGQTAILLDSVRCSVSSGKPVHRVVARRSTAR